MESEQNYQQSTRQPAASDSAGAGTTPSRRQPPKRSGWRIFWRMVLVLSIIANAFLFLALIALAAVFATGRTGLVAENVIKEGITSNKIVVIRLEGIIDDRLSEQLRDQIETAGEDKHVKAVIIRTITPGGGVAASDRIHHEIVKFRQQTQKPVVAFMQTVAASGGYYTSVACDKIIAEPTVITGSIGVMLNHLVIQELLEDKLGIVPVVIKSGPRKNWPSFFSEVTDEQKQYLAEKLIEPAYTRFVKLVAEGRQLDLEEVSHLADGSIYGADEAQQNSLIDAVGYIDEAIAMTESLAGIKDAHVVEYTKPFSLATILGSQSKNIWKMDRNTLHELAVPKLLYLWDIN